jgi:hypothetical protein
VVYGGKNDRQAHTKGEHADLPDLLHTAVEYGAFLINWCGVK